jgi:hypothetical protein
MTTQDHIGRSDQCVQCGELADFAATGRQECVKCHNQWKALNAAAIEDEHAVLDHESVWAAYMEGQNASLGAILEIAENIECMDGIYTIPGNHNVAAAMLIVLGDGIWDVPLVEKFARRGAYHHIRKALEVLYPQASGSLTDPWIAEVYSELYKDDYGFRPRGHMNGKQMREWVARRDAE